MKRNIGALIVIFVCTTIAWFILGGATRIRTETQDVKLKRVVGQLWGTTQAQHAPYVYYKTEDKKTIRTIRGSETVEETVTESYKHPVSIGESDVKVELDLDHRKKGLLWYATYTVRFHGIYTIVNESEEEREMYFQYSFPTAEGVYDAFSFVVENEKVQDLKPLNGQIVEKMEFGPNETKTVEIAYSSQGMDEWWYVFGDDVEHVQNFKLIMLTDFFDIDFPDNSISPTHKERNGDGWELKWEYADLISGLQIGMAMPEKINPGPFVSRVTFFAPVSLFLFFFLMFIITTLSNIRIHPMNYFFIAAAFFSFHLLLAYLADHVDIHLALAISSIVSIFLVISYMRLVVSTRFAFLETGIAQFVYLVVFSYTFFWKGYTGLAITILCVVTLFIVMQLTGKIDWERQFVRDK